MRNVVYIGYDFSILAKSNKKVTIRGPLIILTQFQIEMNYFYNLLNNVGYPRLFYIGEECTNTY